MFVQCNEVVEAPPYDYNGHMKMASVAELKARLSEYLAAARRGEDVIVTDRGRPVARLTRITSTSAARHPHWSELLRAGLMRAPAGKLPADFRKLKRAQDPQGSVADALRAEREENW